MPDASHSAEAAHAQTIVYVDEARNRNHPVVGHPLLRRVCRRTFLGAAIPAIGVPLVWANKATPERLIVAIMLGFVGFSLALFIIHAGALIGDYRKKRGLAEKYGFDLRFGLDTYQRRVVRIEPPPADLSQRIVQALQAIAEDAQVQRTDPDRFEANLSRKGKRMRCRVTVRVSAEDSRAKTLTVESKVSEPLVFNDLGQNIVNVEEFQRALVRLLGAEQRSLAEASLRTGDERCEGRDPSSIGTGAGTTN
jgi:hypothetical protein